MNENHNKKLSVSEYFDIAIDQGALLMDGSNLAWFEYPLYSCLREEIDSVLNDTKTDKGWGYSYPGGRIRLRELISKHESVLEGTKIDMEDVIVGGNGTTGVLNFISQIIAREYNFSKDIEFMYPLPAYSGLKKSFIPYGIKANEFVLDKANDFKLTYEDVENAYNENCVAILICNPANPACKFIEYNELKRIIDFCIDKNMYIIYDAIFEDAPMFENKRVEIFKMANNYPKLIKIKGFSKDTPQLSDLRCGWSVTKNKEFNDQLLELGEAVNYSNSNFSEALGIVEMDHRVKVDTGDNTLNTLIYINEKLSYHSKVKGTLLSAYEFMSNHKDVIEKVILPDAGNILLVYLNKEKCHLMDIHTSHDLFVYILEKENILVTPANCFGLDNSELAFRITISTKREEFLDGLMRIINLFKEGE